MEQKRQRQNLKDKSPGERLITIIDQLVNMKPEKTRLRFKKRLIKAFIEDPKDLTPEENDALKQELLKM